MLFTTSQSRSLSLWHLVIQKKPFKIQIVKEMAPWRRSKGFKRSFSLIWETTISKRGHEHRSQSLIDHLQSRKITDFAAKALINCPIHNFKKLRAFHRQKAHRNLTRRLRALEIPDQGQNLGKTLKRLCKRTCWGTSWRSKRYSKSNLGLTLSTKGAILISGIGTMMWGPKTPEANQESTKRAPIKSQLLRGKG